MELQPEELDVADALDGVHAVLKPLIEKKRQTLELFVEPGVATIFHDPGRFRQIIYNLLSNANKFTPEGGAIRTSAWLSERGQLEVAVADSGVGIRPEDQERIFEAFRQVDSSHARAQDQGTGLGLALVRQLVRQMGGDVAVESEPGRGSTFTFRLPVRGLAATGEPSQPEPAEPAPSVESAPRPIGSRG
jgi:two-component system, NarL family, sensor histidine kinase BarA